MRPSNGRTGFTLVEAALCVLVTSIALLSVMKLMSTSQRTLTESVAVLQAKSSAEELLQQIGRMKWDANSPNIGQMNLNAASPPSAHCSGACPAIADRTGIEHWSQHTDRDTSRPQYGEFERKVSVRFINYDPGTRGAVLSVNPTDRKEVTVTATGRNATATLTVVFYNLP